MEGVFFFIVGEEIFVLLKVGRRRMSEGCRFGEVEGMFFFLGNRLEIEGLDR